MSAYEKDTEVAVQIIKAEDDEGHVTAFVIRSDKELSEEDFLFELDMYLREVRDAEKERQVAGPSH